MFSCTSKSKQKGFALIMVLLLLLLVSAIAVAVIESLNTDQKVQGHDTAHTAAFYSAEAGMEKMVRDTDVLFSSVEAPSIANIQAVGLPGGSPPVIDGTLFTEYSATAQGSNGMPQSFQQTISSGPNQGLEAQIVPIQLLVTADRPGGEEVRMSRSIQVSSIPVFQFGFFTDRDALLQPGQSFDMTGRVQVNGNFYLNANNGLSITFHAPIRVAKEVVRDDYTGTGQVFIPTGTNGCPTPGASTATCRALALNEGSWSGGTWPYTGFDPVNDPTAPPNPSGNANEPTWKNLPYNDFIESFETGATTLTLPFVRPGVNNIEIIRVPPATEDPTSLLGESREFNMAQIRVRFTDDPYDLTPDGDANPDNIRLANTPQVAMDFSLGVPVAGSQYYFAEGTTSAVSPALANSATWYKPVDPTTGSPILMNSWSLLASESRVDAQDTKWTGAGGWLRVEVRHSDGTYRGVTREWLELGFARSQTIPNSEQSIPNSIHPNAILVLQQARLSNYASLILAGPISKNSWYPLNLYDAAEGEWASSTSNLAGTCSLNGVQNVVEIDVKNLKQWLSGAIGSSGQQVENASENGYVLYFSDRRGMLTSPLGYKLGEYGFEDTQSPTPSGLPNGMLDPEEDTQTAGEPGYGVLDTYGASNLGLGFGTLPTSPSSPAAKRVNCRGNEQSTIQADAEPNWVSGARHALRLVDASLGNLPSVPGNTGGFTVASENPIYVLGNYNANKAGDSDPTHFGDNQGLVHVSAGVMADKVKVLSYAWSDGNSFANPFNALNRVASGGWFRFAVSTGASASEAVVGPPGWLEDWKNQSFYYRGSILNIYTCRQATSPGQSSNTNAVYKPPSRNQAFDTDFENISLMPPGTPSLRDVVNVGFQQIF